MESIEAEGAFVEGFRPGYLGRIAAMHGEYYAAVWGSGSAFESLQTRELCDFHDRYDPRRDLLLTAHVGGVLAGSVAIDGTAHPEVARLRWFLVDPACHGRGLGGALLERALTFCRERGFGSVALWTVEGLPRSWAMYERAGFRVTERHPADTFGVEHVHVRMDLALS